MADAPTQPGAARQALREPGPEFDLTPTDEQQMLVEAARDFALRDCRPAALEADTACRTPSELLAKADEIGLVALGIPEAHGGVLEQRSAVTAALVAEALAEGDMGIALACLAPGAFATALGLWGDGEQQATYLPAFTASSAPVAALAVAEPRVLFDPLALSTRAVRLPSGDYRLDGVKAMVPRGAEAELLLVAADLRGAPTLFIVEGTTPGVSRAPDPGMGVRAAAGARVVLEDVSLPACARLDAGPSAYAELIALARLGWSALAVGTAQAILDYVSDYVNARHAFGEPISHRQSVAFMVANIAIELESLRLVTYRAASLAETGGDFIAQAARARALAAQHAMQIGSDGVQLLGGHGYVKEHPVERWYRDLRAAGMLEGALIL
jgi:alkylation response protein AidB-like acyl-CoA dehydrogenase